MYLINYMFTNKIFVMFVFRHTGTVCSSVIKEELLFVLCAQFALC